jgi:hypothetical protein
VISKITVSRGYLFVLFLVALVGCSPNPYRASFVAVVAENAAEGDEAPSPDGLRPNPAVNTQAQILKSNFFWRDYVVPQLSAELSGDSRIAPGYSVSVGEIRRNGATLEAEFKIELKFGGEEVFNAVVIAYPKCRQALADRLEAKEKSERMASSNRRVILEVKKP